MRTRTCCRPAPCRAALISARAGYGGPCPPPGKPHHYHFRLYALKVAKLDLPADASAAMMGFNVHAQSLGSAELTGLYGR